MANITPATPTKLTRFKPYATRKSINAKRTRLLNPHMLVQIINDIMSVFMHDDQHGQSEQWYKKWSTWKAAGIMQTDITIQQLAKLVGYKKRFMSIKEVGQFMIHELDVTKQYISFHRNTKQTEPICHHYAPMVVKKRQATATTLSFHNEKLVQNILSSPSRSRKILPTETNITEKVKTLVRNNTSNNEEDKIENNPYFYYLMRRAIQTM